MSLEKDVLSPNPSAADDTVTDFLKSLERNGFSGEIRRDLATRVVHATDNSIYQFLPAAVVHVRSAQDIRNLLTLAAQPAFHAVSFSPRGGGTGTNGQSLTRGIAVDCSKYMNRILAVDCDEGWVDVEPGVILDSLNAHLKPLGFFFPPAVAPSSRATLGGMIATDACGKGSRIYGRTSNHLLALTCVMSDGSLETISSQTPGQTFDGRLGEAAKLVRSIVTEKRTLIEERFPKMNRFMTGYNLAHVLQPDGSANLLPLLAGSEGTLAITVRARLRITPIPKARRLVLIKYPDFLAALDDAERLQAHDPSAVETLDELILQRVRKDDIYPKVAPYLQTDSDTPVGAINLVEFTGDDTDELLRHTNRLIGTLSNQTACGCFETADPATMSDLWEVRKRGVGLLGNAPGPRFPIPFIEDTAVPPSHLGAYVREFRSLLDQNGLSYGMYGHVDAGCLHVRPELDLRDPAQEKLLRPISDTVCTLVKKYGGVMWGEHGRGLRASYGPEFFGDELYRDLRRIKEAFDPFNQLNPGKIATPLSLAENVLPVESPLRAHFDRQIDPAAQTEFDRIFACNGNGTCFNEATATVMCPTYKVTRNRIHSPKGRAMIVREWLRLGKPATGEFVEEAYQALSGCLACKACTSQCPVHVDIPEIKAKFLDHYHRHHPRSIRELLLAAFEPAAQFAASIAPLANLAISNRIARTALRNLGLVDLPIFSRPGIGWRLRRLNIRQIPRHPPRAPRNAVALLPDAFTFSFEAGLVSEICLFLQRAGYHVGIPHGLVNGKALHLKGFIRPFRRHVARTSAQLHELDAAGYTLIGVEPSVTLTYRDEYEKYRPSHSDAFKVHTLQEWLTAELEAGRLQAPHVGGKAALIAHCMEQTSIQDQTAAWQRVFAAFGCELTLVSTGCCGMAGIFGHEREHAAESKAIFAQNWKPVVDDLQSRGIPVLATGFSCRHQAWRFAGIDLQHPLEFLFDGLRNVNAPSSQEPL